MRTVRSVLAGLSAFSLLPAATLAQNPSQPTAPMTFFVTSVGKGD